MELGPNRETTVTFSHGQPNYIVCSDGLMRVSYCKDLSVNIYINDEVFQIFFLILCF